VAKLSKWLRDYTAVPDGLTRGDARWYPAGCYVYPFGGLYHFFFIFVFWGLGVGYLAWLNVVSSAVYLIGTWLHRRGYITTVAMVAAVEIAVHAVVVSLGIGWGAGFHYYMLLLPIVYPVGMSERPAVKLAVVLGSALAYVSTFLHLQSSPPWTQLSPSVVSVLAALNVAGFFVMPATIAWVIGTFVQRSDEALAAQHQRSEDLLHNILPVPIADRLKTEGATIADGFDSASVLFADIVDFTVFSSKATAREVVELLNEVFSKVDGLVDQYGLEKIKTIGDAYMVAAGVPDPRPDHAETLAKFALDLRAAMRTLRDGSLELRIGIHSGPVVAGVLGTRKFSYDLWGDTVNTASRMESHGTAGQIQVSEQTHTLLASTFDLEERGVIDVKGKGPMKTWYLRSLPSPD